MRFHSLLLSASFVTFAACGIAAAQETPSQGEVASPKVNKSTGLEEIVVTAERRTMNLQTTSIAASVLSGEDLANRGTNLVDQLQFVAPNLTVNNFGQGIDFNIRGIGKGEHNTQTATGVITYRDSVASFPGYFTEEPYYDIARVEILRGPQGTFAGQNATGGAVFVTSNDPVINGGNQGYVQGQIGNYSDYALQGAVNLPITDTLAARLAVNGESRDSFYHIKGPWTGGDGSLSSASLRVGLLWKPDDAWTILFKGDYNSINMGAYPADPVNSKNDIFEIGANADMRALDQFGRAVLKIDYRFSNGMVLRSVSGYQEGNTTYRADLDGTDNPNDANPFAAPWPRTTFRDVALETIYSQEFNLISADSGALRWVVGAYYQSNDYEFPKGEFVVDLWPDIPPAFAAFAPFYQYVLDGTNDTWNAAGFGQVTYDFAGGLQLELGVRYTDAHTTNRVHVAQYGLEIQDNQSDSFSDWSGKIALNWVLNEQNFLYIFAASGFKPGGLNVPVAASGPLNIPDPFGEETVMSYETGWKWQSAGGHVRTQLNAYYNDYKGFQVVVGYPDLPTFGFELNVPNTTTIYGFEAQVQSVFGNFSVDGGVGTTNSSLGKFYAVDPRLGATAVPCNPKTGPESARCVNLDGQDQTYAPQFTFNLGTQYQFNFSGGDALIPRLAYAHISDQWATLFEDKALGDKIDARNIWNAQLAWQHGKIVTTLFGTNISDEHYVGAINSGLRFAGAPMQYGLRVMTTF
jgi:iron complex outermembrane recepter protein